MDNKWHKVKVEADGRGLHLSYRRGYFADDAHVVNPKDETTRTRLLSGGHTVQETPTVRREPIVFSASAQPLATGAPKPQIATPPAAGITRYRVHYAVPVSAFQRHSVQGQSLMDVGMGILALNRNGVVLTRKLRHAEFGIDEDKLSRAPATVVPIDQDVDLAGGDTYLYLVVWDPAGERIGTLNVPLQVPK